MDHLVAAALAHLVQIFGGSLGAAIFALSLGVRVALLPVTVRLALRARHHQAIARSLQSEIDALKRRFAKKPGRLLEETRRLYRERHFSPFDLPTLLGSAVQWPVFGLLYRTIRRALSSSNAFLWIRNLAAPDLILTGVVLFLTALSAWWLPGAPEHARTTVIVIQLLVTSLIVWKLAAGLALYWAASNLVGLAQNLWLRRHLSALTRATPA